MLYEINIKISNEFLGVINVCIYLCSPKIFIAGIFFVLRVFTAESRDISIK